jgi:flavin-dependent dehydrogenase
MIESSKDTDVAIVGGGPAGASAALSLGRAGISVLLLDASGDTSQRIGETLPPAANRLLHELGLWNAFCKQEHHSSEGIISAWIDDKPQVNDFFVSAQGVGWNLDRTRFDSMLLKECENAGVRVCRRSKLLSCCKTDDRHWVLEFDRGGSKHRAKARFLVDASGKLGASALRSLSRRIVLDRLIGVAKFFSSVDDFRYTIVEAVDDGWFYSTNLPQGRVAAMYFTDADIYSARSKSDRDYWGTQLQKARHTRERLGHSRVPYVPRIVSAVTTCRSEFSGDGWIAVGDAAQSFDPLSSLGIYKALDSANRACNFLENLANGRRSDRDYANWSEGVFRNYQRQRAEHYRKQRRWPGSIFWERRRFAAVSGIYRPT